ncbi:MAG: D-alanyl-D-alanine carboxypeptidase family protein [Acidimicrobiales bacterium]
MAFALVSGPIVSSAVPSGDPSSERERVRAQAAQVASQVDALKATDAQVDAALDALAANVAGQQGLLVEARRAAQEAQAAFVEATKAVEAKTAEVATLKEEIRDFAVEAFVHPPSDDALAALDSDDPGEAAQKRALLEIQNTSDADLLDRLTAAEEDLEVQRKLAEDASNRAQRKQAEAEDRLAELESARAQQAAYADQVQARLDHKLSEAAFLADKDASLSKEILAQQARAAELARKAAAASGGSRHRGSGSVSYNGSLANVSCKTGGTITVDSSIASNVQSLLNASPDGIALCGWGWRSSAQQQQLWDAHHCDTGCSVPTAPPGSSMHERGLAIDFTTHGQTIPSRSDPAFQWLSANASSYGLYNLPSEPWHWSTNGN